MTDSERQPPIEEEQVEQLNSDDLHAHEETDDGDIEVESDGKDDKDMNIDEEEQGAWKPSPNVTAVIDELIGEMTNEQDKRVARELLLSVAEQSGEKSILTAFKKIRPRKRKRDKPNKLRFTKLVRFLMDGGANTCLTAHADRLIRRSSPRSFSRGAGGTKLNVNCEGFLRAILPGIEEKYLLFRSVAMRNDCDQTSSFEIMSQTQLEHYGYDFKYSRRSAYMWKPGVRGTRVDFERDPKSGLWFVTLPVVIDHEQTDGAPEISQAIYGSTSPVLFFRPSDNRNGIFSNFYMIDMVSDGITFKYMEQFLHYRKAIMMGDVTTADRIMAEDRPTRCKALGKEVSPFIPERWTDDSVHAVLLEGLRAKFKDDGLARQLLATGRRVIGEASCDANYGIGIELNDPSCWNMDEWTGKNMLGKALMKIRAELADRMQDDDHHEAVGHRICLISPVASTADTRLESEQAPLYLLFEKLEAHGDDILSELLTHHCKQAGSHWIWWFAPCPFPGASEPLPSTHAPHDAQVPFVMGAPEVYFDLATVVTTLIVDSDYDITTVFPPADLRRLRTFVRWLEAIRDIEHVDNQSRTHDDYDEAEFDRRLIVILELRDVLTLALWPIHKTKYALQRQILLYNEGLPDSYLNAKKPPFSTLYDSQKIVSVARISTLQGHGEKAAFEHHCRLGHPSHDVFTRTMGTSVGASVAGKSMRISGCKVCAKLRLRKASRPHIPMYYPWMDYLNVVLHRDIHGPMVTGILGNRFWEVYFDCASEYIWVFPMKTKTGVLTNIKTIHDAYKAKNRAVHVICNDNETLYRGNEMKKIERALHIKQVPFPEYVKNGNRAEPANRIIEQKIMANLLDGMGSPSMWDTCTGLSMAQANRTVKLNSSNPLLHHLTPHQVWNLPNHILKQASDQLRNNEVDIESVLLLAPKNDLSQLRVFLSPAQVYDHTTLRGSLPTNGMAKEGTWVNIGPADDDKSALKLLNLKSLKTTEIASATIQDDFARNRIDELT